MTRDESMDEFLADFGAKQQSDEELDAVLERARQAGDVELRQVVKELKTLRWLGRILLERVEAQPTLAEDQVVKLGRFLLRGEGIDRRTTARTTKD